MNTDTAFEEAHHYKPRSVAATGQQSRKHAVPSPEQRVKAKKPVHPTKEKIAGQGKDERSSLSIERSDFHLTLHD